MSNIIDFQNNDYYDDDSDSNDDSNNSNIKCMTPFKIIGRNCYNYNIDNCSYIIKICTSIVKNDKNHDVVLNSYYFYIDDDDEDDNDENDDDYSDNNDENDEDDNDNKDDNDDKNNYSCMFAVIVWKDIDYINNDYNPFNYDPDPLMVIYRDDLPIKIENDYLNAIDDLCKKYYKPTTYFKHLDPNLPKIKLSDISDVKYAYAINALKND